MHGPPSHAPRPACTCTCTCPASAAAALGAPTQEQQGPAHHTPCTRAQVDMSTVLSASLASLHSLRGEDSLPQQVCWANSRLMQQVLAWG